MKNTSLIDIILVLEINWSFLSFLIYLYCNLVPIVIFWRLNSNTEAIWLQSTSWIRMLRCLTAANQLSQLNDNEIGLN